MRDISGKITTLRIATATATLHLSEATQQVMRAGEVPKGDPLPVAKVAAIMAAKQTSLLIPYCHPLPIDGVDVLFEERAGEIEIRVTVKAIHKTGVEMEALAAASAAALTIYDMLKGIDESMEIGAVRLLKKTGGKSDWRGTLPSPVRAAVLTLSDSVMHGQRQDVSGQLLAEALRGYGVEVVAQDLLGDDVEPIAGQLKYYADEMKLDLVLTTGGTGLGPRDNTPEAMTRVIQREAPGIVEAARNYGQAHMPYAMLSRGKAGLRGKTLIVNLPGSKGGVVESLQALMPHLLHAVNMIAGGGHEDKR